MPGEPIGPQPDRQLERAALAAMVRRLRRRRRSMLGIAPDDPDALRRDATPPARGVDLLVTTGGASVGDHDLVRDVLAGRRAASSISGRSRCGRASR